MTPPNSGSVLTPPTAEQKIQTNVFSSTGNGSALIPDTTASQTNNQWTLPKRLLLAALLIILMVGLLVMPLMIGPNFGNTGAVRPSHPRLGQMPLAPNVVLPDANDSVLLTHMKKLLTFIMKNVDSRPHLSFSF